MGLVLVIRRLSLEFAGWDGMGRVIGYGFMVSTRMIIWESAAIGRLDIHWSTACFTVPIPFCTSVQSSDSVHYCETFIKCLSYKTKVTKEKNTMDARPLSLKLSYKIPCSCGHGPIHRALQLFSPRRPQISSLSKLHEFPLPIYSLPHILHTPQHLIVERQI